MPTEACSKRGPPLGQRWRRAHGGQVDVGLQLWFLGRFLVLPALDIGEAREIADGQRSCITEDGRPSIASYGIRTTAEISEIRGGDPPEVDTVSGVVGDLRAVRMEVAALFYEDAGPAIAADGSDTC